MTSSRGNSRLCASCFCRPSGARRKTGSSKTSSLEPPHTTVGRSTLRLVRGDITRQETDAIVNAANSSLLGGGGVDGAIHRAGGPQILEECRKIRAARGECPPGEAVITGGGNLAARYVIHTVGPVWQGGTADEEGILSSAYAASLALAAAHGCRSVSFPCISTGVYRFPPERAAGIAVRTIRERVRSENLSMEIRFVVFSDRDETIYQKLLGRSLSDAG